MQIAILSDIHDNIWNLEKVIAYLQGQVEAVICLGDFCSPFIPPYIAQLRVPVYSCLGNNDEDQIALLKKGSELFHWTVLGAEYGRIELDGKKIAFCHYPKLAELLARTDEHDAVFHGHDHTGYSEMHGKTLLANPGAVCGIQKGKPGQASFGIYNTQSNILEIIDIKKIHE